MFKQMAGVDLVNVPCKGTGPAVPDLISGQISFMSVEILAAMPHVKPGKLRAFDIATAIRNPGAPDIPTVSEAGYASRFAAGSTPSAMRVRTIENGRASVQNHRLGATTPAAESLRRRSPCAPPRDRS
ncbi:MAG: tripartite tricarboxylate transporter substrate-binding protein [Burkholderiales bacterium]